MGDLLANGFQTAPEGISFLACIAPDDGVLLGFTFAEQRPWTYGPKAFRSHVATAKLTHCLARMDQGAFVAQFPGMVHPFFSADARGNFVAKLPAELWARIVHQERKRRGLVRGQFLPEESFSPQVEEAIEGLRCSFKRAQKAKDQLGAPAPYGGENYGVPA